MIRFDMNAKTAAWVNKDRIVAGRGGVRKGRRFVVAKDVLGRHVAMFVDERTEYVRVVGASVHHLPVSVVEAPVNGTIHNIGKLAIVGDEWLTITEDTRVEECAGCDRWFNKIPKGSKVKLLKRGNAHCAGGWLVKA